MSITISHHFVNGGRYYETVFTFVLNIKSTLIYLTCFFEPFLIYIFIPYELRDSSGKFSFWIVIVIPL